MNKLKLPVLIFQGLQRTVLSKPTEKLTTIMRQFHSSNTRLLKSSSAAAFSSINAQNEVLFEIIKGKGIIALNRPKTLNALNASMIRKIFSTLREWESNDKQLIIMKATGGKAFCAGGDIRIYADSAKAGKNLYTEYFKAEYELAALIPGLHIPYIALIDGITMGAGAGISVHGQFRVATEKTIFAMPETAIGLFPDFGVGFFLSRLSGKLGLYLALTGHRLKGSDVYKAGIATHMCDSSKLPELERDLVALNSNKVQDVETILQQYNEQYPESKKSFSLEELMKNINKSFESSSVEGIISNLKADGSELSQKTVDTLAKMSPTSLKISFKLLEMGEQLKLQDCLKIEYRISQRCCESHDFLEGVRALLVDKDQNPQWKPKTLEEVTPEIVDKYFEPLSEERELIL